MDHCFYCGWSVSVDWSTDMLVTRWSGQDCGVAPGGLHHLTEMNEYQLGYAALIELAPHFKGDGISLIVDMVDDYIDAGSPGGLVEFARNWYEANHKDYELPYE